MKFLTSFQWLHLLRQKRSKIEKKHPFAHKETLSQECWCSLPADEIFRELKTCRTGLKETEVQKRLEFYGTNTLPDGKEVTIFEIVLHQILNPLVLILIAAALVSVLLGEYKDAIFIFLVIAINTSLGTYQEYNAERSIRSLQQALKIIAKVRRHGVVKEIPAQELVPGDIVLLESGMKVPADIRLYDIQGLEIDESFLTGESLPVKKNLDLLTPQTAIAEQKNMAFANSTVVRGRGEGVVVCTGVDTQVGKIFKDIQHAPSAKPPLIIRMERFTKQLTYFFVILGFLMAILLRTQGIDAASIFFFVVALAVSAIPEGLPVAMTVALSVATHRMAKRNVLVRRLTSVESLGSCTVIASDKTGTLTLNEQTAKIIQLPDKKQYKITGQGYNGIGHIIDEQDNEIVFDKASAELKMITLIAAFANEAKLYQEEGQWKKTGDAIDVALLGMCYKFQFPHDHAMKHYQLLDRIPYESDRKYSGAFVQIDGKMMILVKGATEILVDFCQYMSVDGEVVPIDKTKVLQQMNALARKGYRVLAFAASEVSQFQKKENYELEEFAPLTFYGLVGFIDPLRPESRDAVRTCHKAGIKVLMITGDHPETAATIARQLGIATERTPIVTGQMLTQIGPQDSPAFVDLVTSSTVFARVSPEQKRQIVDVYIRKGEFVAVTGDGVNDAPAMKRAHIGVAMGSGTDLAKEVSSMIITDDNFASIVAGVEEGRAAYDNVRKVTYLLISTGAAEIIFFVMSVFASLPIPLLPVQILWLNLVTNGIQDVALAFEGKEPFVMKKQPRNPKESIFDKRMIQQVAISGLTIGLIVFGFWLYLIQYLQMELLHARNLTLLLMVFMQNFHVFNCRSEIVSTFKIPIKRNYLLVLGVLLAQGIHILSTHLPFMQQVLKIDPIPLHEWFYVLLLAMPIIFIMEIFKLVTKSSYRYLSD